jgi:trehalose/maltose transport system substrate-binding protein
MISRPQGESTMTGLKRLAGALALAWLAFSAQAETLNIVHGAIGKDDAILRRQLNAFEAATGHKVNIVSMPESTTDQFVQ